jgi:hypothetical protein
MASLVETSRWLLRVVVSLLVAVSAGCGFYTLAAIVWAILDPDVAAQSLLFTIPIAIAGAIVPALLAAFVPRVHLMPRGRRTRRPQPSAAPAAASTPPAQQLDPEDLRFAA